METSNATKTCPNGSTFEKEKVVLVCYATFAAIAVIFHVAAIFITIKTRAYRNLHHRLTLYLTIGGILRSVAFVLQVLPVDIDVSDTDLVRVREGWTGVCVLGGFMVMYIPLFQTFTVVWTSFIVLAQVINYRRYNQIGLKHEIAGVTIAILAPAFLFTWEPFITNAYGFSGTRCWIVDEDCTSEHDSQFAYVLALNTLPNFLLSLVGLSLIGGAIFVITRKVITGNSERFFGILIKEKLPLALYPTIYMLLIFARLIPTLSGIYTNIVSLAFMAMIQLSSFTLPLSLLLRPSVRRTLCQSTKIDDLEDKPGDENNEEAMYTSYD